MARSLRYRRRHLAVTALVAFAVWLFTYAQNAGWIGEAGKAVVQNAPGRYSVTSFVDGDTIAVSMNGRIEKVRFIGVDTPETHKPNTPVQCYGPAAAAYTKNTIGTNSVRLVSDSLTTDRDRYNRLLRYVYLPDGTLVNQKLIQNGYGFYYPYFPFSKSDQFSADQDAAIKAKKGLWGNCNPTQTDKGGWISNNQD